MRTLVVGALTLACAVAAPRANLAAEAARLLRTASGPRGSVQGGRFVIDEPRNVFHAAEDRQVVVYFEWEGTPGPHECKASWKDPSGSVVLVAPFKLDASGRRFSVYWSLALAEGAPPGLWAVETEVDGQPSGVHTFTVKAGSRSAEERQGARRVVTVAEAYERARVATLAIEALDAQGSRLGAGSGFRFEEGSVITAFQVIEGASRVRITPPGDAAVETDELAAWNRRQDWAILRTPGLSARQLPLDRTRSWKVGDRCSFLEIEPNGSRVAAEASIVGAQEFPKAGARISLSAYTGSSLGGPLLNEFGEAIGVLGGSLTPGSNRAPHAVIAGGLWAGGNSSMAVPLSSVPAAPGSGSTRLSALAAQGVFMPPLVGRVNVITGSVARDVRMQSGVPIPVDEKLEFRRTEGEAVAFLTFDPQEKREGQSVFRIYDLDNTLVLQGRPSKISLRPRVYAVSTWRFPLAGLPPDTYRLQLDIGPHPVWRTFFRVVD